MNISSSNHGVICREVPFLVIGTGIAGLTLALKLAKEQQVFVIAKTELRDSNTWYAQGGIASVLDATDSFEQHAEDTLTAGAGLCHSEIVDMVVRAGPRLVRELIEWGCQFTTSSEKGEAYHLTREGGHSQRRVIHAEDLTGREVMRALIEAAVADPNITVVENQMAIDLITTDKYSPDFGRNRCLGAYVLDCEAHQVYRVIANQTFLCTGGHGKSYLYTTNPDVATGDGLAMGWRAGCRVANLEFMQFHPTCLYHAQARRFLISEAVRGEGGILRTKDGHDFMPGYHPMGSLAPRDIVARAIDTELKRTGDTNVFLDVTHLGEEKVARFFPNIRSELAKVDIDMVNEWIPVVPAAHYNCGGIVVDDKARTGIDGLYALGETACTGLHGANRLASNSLLEALVFADRAAADALATTPKVIAGDWSDVIPPWNPGDAAPLDELVVLSHSWDEIRRLMWHYVGIVRSEKRLKRARTRIEALRQELDTYYWDYEVTAEMLEVRNLALVASLTIRCAMARKESRGIHCTLDYPELDDVYGRKDTVLR